MSLQRRTSTNSDDHSYSNHPMPHDDDDDSDSWHDVRRQSSTKSFSRAPPEPLHDAEEENQQQQQQAQTRMSTQTDQNPRVASHRRQNNSRDPDGDRGSQVVANLQQRQRPYSTTTREEEEAPFSEEFSEEFSDDDDENRFDDPHGDDAFENMNPNNPHGQQRRQTTENSNLNKPRNSTFSAASDYYEEDDDDEGWEDGDAPAGNNGGEYYDDDEEDDYDDEEDGYSLASEEYNRQQQQQQQQQQRQQQQQQRRGGGYVDDESTSVEYIEDAPRQQQRVSNNDGGRWYHDDEEDSSEDYTDYDPNNPKGEQEGEYEDEDGDDEEAPFVDNNNSNQVKSATRGGGSAADGIPPPSKRRDSKSFLYAGIVLLCLSLVFSILAIVFRNAGKTTPTSTSLRMQPPPPNTRAPVGGTVGGTTTNTTTEASTTNNATRYPDQFPQPPITISHDCANLCDRVACCNSPEGCDSVYNTVAVNCDDYDLICESYFNSAGITGSGGGFPDPSRIAKVCDNPTIVSDWTECNINCGIVACCFDDGLDCDTLYPNTNLDCNDYQACSTVFDGSDTNNGVLRDSISEACSGSVDTLYQCQLLCAGSQCCHQGGREDTNNCPSNVDCEKFADCKILHDIPDPQLVQEACISDDDANNEYNCAAICQPLLCCANDELDCTLAHPGANIDCSAYEPCVNNAMNLEQLIAATAEPYVPPTNQLPSVPPLAWEVEEACRA